MLVVSIFGRAEQQSRESFVKETNVKVAMSDSVMLATDVYRPSEGKKFGTILIRTPYSKEQGLVKTFAEFFAGDGYAVVIQDCRGKFASEGEFLPFVSERKDGLQTLEWIIQQPWSNREVAAWGPSYLGYCGIVLAVTKHPALKTMVNISGLADVQTLVFPGGALHLMVGLPQSVFMAKGGQAVLRKINWPEFFKFLPLNNALRSIAFTDTVWKLFADPELFGEHSTELALADQLSNIQIPILHITGWNDFTYRGTLQTYVAADRALKSQRKRGLQKLVVGPWHHDQQWSGKTKVGEEEFGPQAQMDIEKMKRISLRWFDCFLKGIDNGVAREPAADIFVMGRNDWIKVEEWPTKGIEYQSWYLASVNGAATLSGDGRLSLQRPAKREFDVFTFDPLNPVPTRGGVNSHFFDDYLGIKDQRAVEARTDVLVYSSEPLKKDTEVLGPLKVVLYASSEGRDTDFTAKLVEVRPDGYARIVEDGIVRARYRNSSKRSEWMEPGKIYKFEIDLGSTALLVRKGSRLRLEISSSNFPKYDRNPNTGESPFDAVELKKVNQKIYHTEQYPSHLLMPVRVR
jgi:hypothetical protein